MYLLVIVDERNTFDTTIVFWHNHLKKKYVYINNLVDMAAAST